jgi:arylsulfatase A-like enzyme
MNVILVMSDTFRYDNLSCYGPTPVKTPRLDEFAGRAFVFDNAYLGSFPTIPNRLDIASGRFSCIDHHWCPLPKETVTLQQILSASGFVTQLIADNPHLVEMGFNYDRGFDGWEWIRGQETDQWKTSPRQVALPAEAKKLRSPDSILSTHLRNTAWWTSEEDRFVARTIRAACQWLEENQDLDQFFLSIDTFDPHEPWDAPRDYVDMYDPGYQGEEVSYPIYGFWHEFLTEAELNHTRSLYMAETTLVDHWLGVLLDKIEELGLAEDTAVVFTSDHGFLFGEHGIIGKSLIRDDISTFEAIPLYDEIRRTPLLISLPGQTAGQHLSALVQSPDLMPTVLEMAGLIATESIGGQSRTQALQCGVFYTEDWEFKPEATHGKSLMPLMRGETKWMRDIAVSSHTLIHPTSVMAKCAIVTEDGWCLHYAGKYVREAQDVPLIGHKLTNPEAARVPMQPMLFYLPDDPHEERDVVHDNRGLAREIHERYVNWLWKIGTTPENLAGRRELW